VFDSPNRFRVVRARMGPELPFTPAKEEDAFVQDTWTITPRIVLRAGVRYTEERIDGAGTFTLPFGTQTVMNEVSPGNFVPTRIFTAGTSTYRPNRYSFSGNWAPRIGGVKLPYEDEISGGYRFEVTPASSFEVRAIFRNQGRVLEDTQVNAVEQIQNFYYGPAYGYPYDPFGGTPAKPNSSKFPATPF